MPEALPDILTAVALVQSIDADRRIAVPVEILTSLDLLRSGSYLLLWEWGDQVTNHFQVTPIPALSLARLRVNLKVIAAATRADVAVFALS